ncbi:MAG: hypothetical protein GY754_34075 [bacterium]|nr:hypothetical protein [bacterium]
MEKHFFDSSQETCYIKNRILNYNHRTGDIILIDREPVLTDDYILRGKRRDVMDKFEGAKYEATRELSFPEVAEYIEWEIQEEMKVGHLPECAFTIEKSENSFWKRICINVTSTPFNPIQDSSIVMTGGLSFEGLRLIKGIEKIANRYNYDLSLQGSPAELKSGDCRFFLFVGFDKNIKSQYLELEELETDTLIEELNRRGYMVKKTPASFSEKGDYKRFKNIELD